MKRSKLFFLLMSIVLVIVFLPVFFVIAPVHRTHILINKEEQVLKIVEKKSQSISKRMVVNSKNIGFLQKKLQERSILIFLEHALKISQLSIDSIQPSQGAEKNEIHLIIKGEYRALLNFFSLLSQQTNSVVFENLIIEKDHMEIILKNDSEQVTVRKTKRRVTLLKRLAFALEEIKAPTFSMKSMLLLDDVQSPFVPRVFPKHKHGPFQLLEDADWYLSGEVRKNGILLGIFLEAKDRSQSRYFGVNSIWEDSHWRITNITRRAVVFEESKKHSFWRLVYHAATI